jgi:hypothetical protein
MDVNALIAAVPPKMHFSLP